MENHYILYLNGSLLARNLEGEGNFFYFCISNTILSNIINLKTITIMSEFKQCPNGHYYQGDHCPYCKDTVAADGDNSRTVIIGAMPHSEKPTVVQHQGGNIPGVQNLRPTGSTNTIFGPDIEALGETNKDAVEALAPNQPVSQGSYSRKLVGWLVSYTLDSVGVDFRIFEGRNIIGRDPECSISIDDGYASGTHAVLLYRAGKYSITDQQSSHGTFVNDEDIDLEPRYLKDGDVIRVGKTVLKFRSSL